MASPSRVRITGPLTPLIKDFAAELIRQGYRPGAAARQLQLIAHLSRWLAVKGLGATDLTASILAQFLTARRSQGYTLWLSRKALTPFTHYLHAVGLVPAAKVEPSAIEELLTRYGRYLVDTRGLAETSTRAYVDMVRPFVATRLVDNELDWEELKRTDLTAFVRRACRNRSGGSARLLAAALRSLLGYLHIEGLIRRPLSTAVPSVAGSKLAGLPRSLEAGQVDRLLAACDRRTRTGRRDFAMIILLVRLGLRAGEVRALSLDDVDWRAGELVVRGKGNRVERLPLPSDVGNALAAYLRHARSDTAQGRTIFVRIHAPHRALTSAAVSNAVQMAASRARLGPVSAHRLRHTVATQMVRSGVPLPEISQVLRHRQLLTTAIYAKVDREGLRRLARPWPGGVL